MPKILIMGLPGSGKTTLAEELSSKIGAQHLNADNLRKQYNDWDFSPAGRIRQAERMRDCAMLSSAYYVVADFVAPIPEMRKIFNPDVIVWMDTIHEGRYEDTNKLFVPPKTWDYRITEYDCKKWATIIATNLNQLQQHLEFGFDNTVV